MAAKHNHEPNEQTIRQKLFVAHRKEQIREYAMPLRKIFHDEIVKSGVLLNVKVFVHYLDLIKAKILSIR